MKRFFSKKTLLTFCGALLFAATVPADDWKAPSSAILEAARMPKLELSKSKWLWSADEKNTDQKSCYYRFQLDLKAPVKEVELVGYLDDAGTVYCNGKAVAGSKFEQKNTPVKARKYILTPYVAPGKNLLAVEVRNDLRTGGLIFLGKITYADGKSEFFHTDANWKATSKLAAGQWMQPDFDDSRWPAAVPFGDVGQKPWFNLSDVANLCTGDDEKQKLREWLDNYYKLPDGLAGEKQRVCKIVWKNGLPAFSDGTREYPPQMFRIHSFAGANMEKESDILLKVCMAAPHLVETGISSSAIERDAGVYDFSLLDRQVGTILKLVPDASLVVQLRIDSLDEFLRKNPDEGIGYATGPADNTISKEIWNSLDLGGRKIAPSYASQKFRDEFCNFIVRFAEYIRQRPWSRRLVAVRVTNGCYSEWHYFGMAGQMPDTGKAMTRAFREFAREKYQTVEALRKAWHDDKVDFETVTVPGVEERWGKKRFLRDSGSADRKVMDYYICHQKMIAESVIAAARAVKSVLPDVLVGTYYGYVLGMAGFPSEGQTLFLEEVLSSPYIDFLSSPYSYAAAARKKGGDGLLRMIPATFLRHKKLALNEMDNRTHLMKKPLQFTDAQTADESAQMFLRDYALSELSGIGDQLVDMGLRDMSWFNHPKILTAIHTANAQWLAIRDAVRPQANEIGVIFNPRELYLHGHPVVGNMQFNRMLADQQLHALYKSGYPFDLMTLDDYLAENRPYRVLVFLNAITLTERERAELITRTRHSGVTAIWCYAPGLVTENRWSEAAMAELTGMTLRVRDEKLPMALESARLGKIGRSDVAESPRVSVDDPTAESMGKYEDGTVGLAVKSLPGQARSIVSAVPVTGSAVWAELLGTAGARAYTAPGIFIKVVDPFILVHVAQAGSYPVSLPGRAARVTDVYDGGKVVASDTDKFVLTCNGCKTWLLKVE